MLLNFLVVGAQKAGTTSLHYYMREHPDIYVPNQKETKFFVHDHRYRNGLSFYERTFFSDWIGESAVGEVDPEYMYIEHALDRMCEVLDMEAMKFIFLLRNPIDRAFSHYVMEYKRGNEPLDFESALEAESERVCRGCMENIRYSYVSRGYYLRQIERFLEHAPRRNMLFLLSDDLKNDTGKHLGDLFNFLDVAEDFLPANMSVQFHRSTWPRSAALARWLRKKGGLEKRLMRALIPSRTLRKMVRLKTFQLNQTTTKKFALTERVRRHLETIYRDENARLGTFLGRDLSHWK